MREACLLALRVAAEGEMAEPRIPSPTAIRPIMGFARMSAAAYGKVRQIVEDDAEFRARVAEAAVAAGEGTVGRAGLLWLTRPEGWQDDPVFAEAPGTAGGVGGAAGAGGGGGAGRKGRQGREQGVVDAKLARAREKADKADEARRRAQEQRAVAAAEVERQAAELTEVRQRVAELEVERNTAVRTQKELESKLAQVRRDLKLSRAATRQAEEELLAARAGGAPAVAAAGVAGAAGAGRSRTPASPEPVPSVPSAAAVSAVSAAPTPPPPPAVIDGTAARAAVHAAAGAAAELARALEAAAAALDPAGSALPGRAPGSRSEPVPGGGQRAGDRRKDRPDRRSGRRRRRPPSLPPGVFDDSPEARRHLVSDPEVQVVVDGYNLAREAWTGLEPEEERRRTVAMLEEAATRSGATVVVVFDGDDSAVAPAASRVVRVLFSATGVTADDHISSLVRTIPPERPVLVVSSDRAVADDARADGAAVLSSAEFLAALGR